MQEFNYNKLKVGQLICMTTLSSSSGMFCNIPKDEKLFARIIKHTDFLMDIKDENKNVITFLSEWFKETKDEYHGCPTFFNPDGIKVKFHVVDHKELPFKLRFRSFFGWF